jgi:hypothetical protein
VAVSRTLLAQNNSKKRLAIFLDGTWNSIDSNTNDRRQRISEVAR